MIFELLLIGALVLISGFFSGAETAFFSLRQGEIIRMKEQKKKHAEKIALLRDNPDRLLTTILVGNNLVNILAAALATDVAIKVFDSHAIGIATGLLTITVLIFGEILPKSFAYTYNQGFARVASVPITFLYKLFYPISVSAQFISEQLKRMLRVPAEKHITEDEVRIMSRISMEAGNIEKDEHELIRKVFKLNDIQVGSIMVPMSDVHSFGTTTTVTQLVRATAKLGYSRYPVIDTDGAVIGYVTDHAIITAVAHDEMDKTAGEMMKGIRSVPAYLPIDDVLRSMKRSGIHMHLVHDAQDDHRVIGVVTLEDVIEELLGEIEDEEDKSLADK